MAARAVRPKPCPSLDRASLRVAGLGSFRNEWIRRRAVPGRQSDPECDQLGRQRRGAKNNVSFLRKLNELNMEAVGKQDSQLDATIKSMETAYRMQTEAPED